MISRVSDKTGETVQAHGMMYMEVDQLVILYERESWVVKGVTLKFLEGFHHQADMRIMGTKATRGTGGEWDYTPVVAALESAGLHPIMMEYFRRRQANIAENVECLPIYEL